MKFGLLIIVILLALGCVAWSAPQFQINQKKNTAEGVVFWLCAPSNYVCTASYPAKIVPGTGSNIPPVGAYCYRIGGDDLSCGKCYAHLRLETPPN